MSSNSCTPVTGTWPAAASFAWSIVITKSLPLTTEAYSRPSGPTARLVGPLNPEMPTAVPDEPPATAMLFGVKLTDGGGGEVTAPTATLSNVDVFSWLVSWLVTASPTNTVVAMLTVMLPTEDQVVPSPEMYAAMVEPDRARRTHMGADAPAPATKAACAPVLGRSMNSKPPPFGLRSSSACADPAVSVSRIITPALA